MISLLISAAVGLIVSIFGTPWLIKILERRSIGQFIQEELVSHSHKQGIPTMGGVVFVVATFAGYLVAHLVTIIRTPAGTQINWLPTQPGGLLVLLAFGGMALVGFLDDWVKYTRKRSLGLSKSAKFGGQLVVAALFSMGASGAGVVTQLSFIRPLGIDLGVFFVVFVLLMLTGFANGVNFADGMDGLAAGSASLVVAAYIIIGFWQFRNPTIYSGVSPLELAIVSAGLFGAILGFLWWNAPPARIIMGDVGSQAIGGLIGAVAILTNTSLLLFVIGAIYVVEAASVVIQVVSFRLFKRRVFRMAPVHHHFDLKGWPETTVVIRFWILTGIGVALGLGLFYADFLRLEGLL